MSHALPPERVHLPSFIGIIRISNGACRSGDEPDCDNPNEGGEMKTIQCAAAVAALAIVMTAPVRAEGVPEFRVDPYWPRPLPNNWILGQIGGIATGPPDHVWVYHPPPTLPHHGKN